MFGMIQNLRANARDAARYRWLSGNNYDRKGATQIHTWVHTWEPHSQTGEPTEWKNRVRGWRLDCAIDVAMGIEHKQVELAEQRRNLELGYLGRFFRRITGGRLSNLW